MRKICLIFFLITLISCTHESGRVVEDFNRNWKFHLGNEPKAFEVNFDVSSWETLNVPHDWSIERGYHKEGETASSTGFVVGGIGWYRKSFSLSASDKGKHISILFDGVYNNSSVWINGHILGTRPNGYSSFGYDLTPHLKFDGTENVIAVKVDRKAYVDSRWYTGSGIYRKVRLIKTAPIHIKQWGVQITTPEVSQEKATIQVKTELENSKSDVLDGVTLSYAIYDEQGVLISQKENEIAEVFDQKVNLNIVEPKLWSVRNPNLYSMEVRVFQNGTLIDTIKEIFGIRIFKFDANQGFSLNGERMKIKGVNLHHDAGAVGAAVPKGIWEYRIKKLKSIGVNAVRFAHNPHSKELLEVCDNEGILVMNEAFDEWSKPKGKNKVYIGDNAASEEASKAYPMHFYEWAERDLKDLIRRDINHPSVIMWSIGNEIEWTYPHYSAAFNDANVDFDAGSYDYIPEYDSLKVKAAFDKNMQGADPLVTTARKLVKWVKEVDTTRPVTCGSVLPSVGMASGYGQAVDVYGFNYRAADYDAAHEAYPDLKILGSENWGNYNEWKSIAERDFVSGIFVWTGFAYLGEAGPWPRKGLEISFFDYAGFKTPRGHFYECLWKEEPKVYMVTTPAKESEFSIENGTWKYQMQLSPPPVWSMLRLWEWYKVYPKWNYETNESIIVQTYTNCDEAELFLNGKSLGKQKRSDFSDDNILKWAVDFSAGELKVIGYNNGEKVDEYVLNTHKNDLGKIDIVATETELDANGDDVTIVTVKMLDAQGNSIVSQEQEVTFSVSGPARNLGVDNGWEMNVKPHKTNKITTHLGKAILILQATEEKGEITVSATSNEVTSKVLKIITN